MLKISVFNFKGGTGKSSTALNLGAALASSKRQVLLVDLDGQRTLSFALGMDGAEPTTLDWLTNKKTVAPTPTQVKHLSLIPGDIGMFRLTAEEDLFTRALSQLQDFIACCTRLFLKTLLLLSPSPSKNQQRSMRPTPVVQELTNP